MSERVFTDDEGNPVNTVTAEQHALDNPGHVVSVFYGSEYSSEVHLSMPEALHMKCVQCDWFDCQGI